MQQNNINETLVNRSRPEAFALAGFVRHTSRVAPRKSESTGLHFGEKVRAWLNRNKAARPRRHPCSDSELAKECDEDQPLISRALNSGNPKLEVARKIAARMGESLDYLADPLLKWPINDEDEAWDSFVGSLSPSQRGRLAVRMRQAGVRDLLLGGQGSEPSLRALPRP